MEPEIEAVALADAALRRGDLLRAYDIAATELAGGVESERLQYLQLLSLARMGDTAPALALYRRYGLDRSDDVDCLSLAGRLAKDAALAAPEGERGALLGAASEAYRQVWLRTGAYFPAINAASLAFLAGQRTEAAGLAERVLAMPEIASPRDYYAAATVVEALLLLGDIDRTATAARHAAPLAGGDDGALSSTRRQLNLLADEMVLSAGDRDRVLAPFRAPPVLMFAGHMFRADAAVERRLVEEIEAVLDRHDVRIGYGALACGADLLVAEALLRRGAELAVVLPFAAEEFVRQSVMPGGQAWLARFHAALEAAHSVDFASDAGFVGDDHQFSYGSLVAMGSARLRARHLGTSAIQLAIWDGAPAAGAAGTAVDVSAWQSRGGAVEIIRPAGADRRLDRPARQSGASPHARELRAIIFSDFAGFSKLSENVLPLFWGEVMGRIGKVLRRWGDTILGANSWGDALFAYTADPVTAAEIALELQAEVNTLPLGALGLGHSSGMRFGVHFGPVFTSTDPITGRPNIFGTEVTRTARIEPIAPTGEVYVTQQFAAMLAMAGDGGFATTYVGQVNLAKSYGALKMFKLSRPDQRR